ncbi:MAG: hypothetical protein JSW24_03495 [Dehalococcoidia bacterium]|nr:MAG: hypothetical protein JSW24_03495 [Dehalococcoidia bacterium]
MKRVVLVVILATFIAASSFSVALAKPAAPAPKDIDKVVFIHYRAPGKPWWAGPKEPKEKEDEGYKLFRGGVKWAELPVSYAINENVDASARAEITAAFEEWDANTTKELYNNTVGTTDKAGANQNWENTIAWVDTIANSNIIAITTFWFYVNTKELFEFDIEFNANFAWGIDPDGEGTEYELTSAMDIRNIATHEAGHTLVLSDLYQGQYAGMTMYGYSEYGEVKKISLESGDIAGLHKLYGE